MDTQKIWDYLGLKLNKIMLIFMNMILAEKVLQNEFSN